MTDPSRSSASTTGGETNRTIRSSKVVEGDEGPLYEITYEGGLQISVHDLANSLSYSRWRNGGVMTKEGQEDILHDVVFTLRDLERLRIRISGGKDCFNKIHSPGNPRLTLSAREGVLYLNTSSSVVAYGKIFHRFLGSPAAREVHLEEKRVVDGLARNLITLEQNVLYIIKGDVEEEEKDSCIRKVEEVLGEGHTVLESLVGSEIPHSILTSHISIFRTGRRGRRRLTEQWPIMHTKLCPPCSSSILEKSEPILTCCNFECSVNNRLRIRWGYLMINSGCFARYGIASISTKAASIAEWWDASEKNLLCQLQSLSGENFTVLSVAKMAEYLGITAEGLLYISSRNPRISRCFHPQHTCYMKRTGSLHTKDGIHLGPESRGDWMELCVEYRPRSGAHRPAGGGPVTLTHEGGVYHLEDTSVLSSRPAIVLPEEYVLGLRD